MGRSCSTRLPMARMQISEGIILPKRPEYKLKESKNSLYDLR